mmetsp:Transcript_1555/g.2553  ORF Transcript_1555/g.2553 Transcript_1555/m.2553 type:complete len:249 (-) Transcript_1555:50-796(-)
MNVRSTMPVARDSFFRKQSMAKFFLFFRFTNIGLFMNKRAAESGPTGITRHDPQSDSTSFVRNNLQALQVFELNAPLDCVIVPRKRPRAKSWFQELGRRIGFQPNPGGTPLQKLDIVGNGKVFDEFPVWKRNSLVVRSAGQARPADRVGPHLHIVATFRLRRARDSKWSVVSGGDHQESAASTFVSPEDGYIEKSKTADHPPKQKPASKICAKHFVNVRGSLDTAALVGSGTIGEQMDNCRQNEVTVL